ncbi:MAG: 4'-phosphopantetheinyl transferase superfamily protein [Oscillochloris sp.]|nr:4'-phosphopantetheinyl transferase superfamily protein [Oscillochloris sp.]
MIDWLIVERNRLPSPEQFLAPPEQERYAALRSEKRRQDWLLGRWAAKRLLRRHMARRGLDLPLGAALILSDPDGAPRVAAWGLALACPHIGVELERIQISLSHSGERALCAMIGSGPTPIYIPTSAMALGADIEQIATRSAAFAQSYDTERELALLAAAPPDRYDTLSTVIWSAKEATLKLTRHGLRVDTRSVTCLPAAPPRAGDWAPVAISTQLTPTSLVGWWREIDNYVITIVTAAEWGAAPSAAHLPDWEAFGEGGARPVFALSE